MNRDIMHYITDIKVKMKNIIFSYSLLFKCLALAVFETL